MSQLTEFMEHDCNSFHCIHACNMESPSVKNLIQAAKNLNDSLRPFFAVKHPIQRLIGASNDLEKALKEFEP